MFNNLPIILGSSSSSVVNYFEVTYAEIIQLVEDASLIPGSYYLIEDFQTIYDQPDFWLESTKEANELETKTSEVIEPLLCIATAENLLEKQVYSLAYPNDVIHYDVRFLQTEIKHSPAKGRITYRKDDTNNITTYDHRHVYFKRYNSISGDPLVFYEYRDNGLPSAEFLTFVDNNSRGNSLINFTENSGFLLPNNVFSSQSSYNYFDSDCINNFFGQLEDNRFFDNVSGNIIFLGQKNNISSSFYRNRLNAFNYNRLTDSFDNNVSTNDFSNNISNNYISGCLMTTFKNNSINVYLEEIDFSTALLVANDFSKTIYSDKALGHRLSYYENDIQIFANITD